MDATDPLPASWTVQRIRGGVGRDFIRQHHYSKGCHNGPMTWGLFDGLDLIGWRPEYRQAKHRYYWLLGDGPAHRRRLRSMVKLTTQPYPVAPEGAA